MSERTIAPVGGTWRPAMWLALATTLVAPAVAMQFTREVAWTGYDFAMAALMLGALGLAIEAIARSGVSRRGRVMLGAAAVALVALVWAEGAVGIIS